MEIYKATSVRCTLNDLRNDGSNMMVCGICGFKASSFNEMSDHLDCSYETVRQYWFARLYQEGLDIFYPSPSSKIKP